MNKEWKAPAADELPSPRYCVSDPKGNHKYQIYGVGVCMSNLVSVTSVLDIINKPALVGWAANTACDLIRQKLNGLVGMPVKITEAWIEDVIAEGRKRPQVVKDESADIGSRAHQAFEDILKGKSLTIPDILKEPVSEFKKWFSASGIQIAALEIPVGSLCHQFGGRIDAIGIRDGKWGILDWKTSTGIWKEYALQVAGGYAMAIEEMYGIYISWSEIVRFSKKEPFGSEVKPITDMRSSKKGFMAALELKRVMEADLVGPASYSTFEDRAKQSKIDKEKAKKEIQEKTKVLGF